MLLFIRSKLSARMFERALVLAASGLAAAGEGALLLGYPFCSYCYLWCDAAGGAALLGCLRGGPAPW